LRGLDLTTRTFDSNARDSTGIRFPIHSYSILDRDKSQIKIQGKTQYQEFRGSAVSYGAQCRINSSLTHSENQSINQSVDSFKEQDKKARGALTIAQKCMNTVYT